MPYIPTSPDDEEEKKKQAGGMPGLTSPGGGGAAAAPAGGGMPTTPRGGGSSFVNLQDYVRANQGASKAMGDKVAGGVEAKGQVGSLIQGGLAKPAQSPMTGLISASKPGTAGGPATPLYAASSAGLASSSNPNASGGLAGLMSPESRNANELKEAQKAEGAAKLAGTQGGRQELLRQDYGATSQGESDLDNALLGNAAGGRLDAAGKKFGGLTDMLRQRQVESATARQQAQSELDAVAAAEPERRRQAEAAVASDEATIKAHADKTAADKDAAAKAAMAGKQSWDDYSKFDVGEALFKVATTLDPVDQGLNALGIRNPIHDVGASVYGGAIGHDKDNNYSRKIEFSDALPPGHNSAANQKAVYESLTAEELKWLGTQPRNERRGFITMKAKKLGLVPAGVNWYDENRG